jgi:membrane protein DedA with SNARE-associated domain
VASHLVSWLVEFGPLVLFFAQVFGIVGLPIPDEFLLTVAGALVQRGQLNGVATIAAAIAGCTCGITFSYTLGRTVGLHAIHKYVRVHKQGVERAQRWFQRFGGWLLMFGYFIPGVRHVSAIAAGSADLTYPRFARFAYPGAVLWCSTFLSAGYFGGQELEGAFAALQAHLAGVLITAAAALAISLLVLRGRRTSP